MESRLTPWLVLASLLAPVAGAFAAGRERTDPSGDVYAWTVSDQEASPGFQFRRAEARPDVDLRRAALWVGDEGYRAELTVEGRIRGDADVAADAERFEGGGFRYAFALDVGPGNGSEYFAVYHRGEARLEDAGGDRVAWLAHERDGADLVLLIPRTLLGGDHEPDWTASAVESRVAWSQGAWQTESFVDVVGPFPDYESLAGLDPLEADAATLPAWAPAGFLLVLAAVWWRRNR